MSWALVLLADALWSEDGEVGAGGGWLRGDWMGVGSAVGPALERLLLPRGKEGREFIGEVMVVLLKDVWWVLVLLVDALWSGGREKRE